MAPKKFTENLIILCGFKMSLIPSIFYRVKGNNWIGRKFCLFWVVFIVFYYEF